MLAGAATQMRTLASWVTAPASPCSVEQVRDRLVRALVAVSLGLRLVRTFLCLFLFGIDPSVYISAASVAVLYICFLVLNHRYIAARHIGDAFMWMLVIKYACQLFESGGHFHSLDRFAWTAVPLLAVFVCSRTTFVLSTVAMGILTMLNFFQHIGEPPPMLGVSISDFSSLYNLVACTTCTVIVAKIYVQQAQLNYNALAASLQNIEGINNAKRTFVSNLSHELRTPLHAILAAASFVRSDIMQPQHKMFLNTILTSGDTIKAMVSNILDMSQMETDMLEWNCQTFDVASLVEELANSFSVFARTKAIQVQLAMPMAEPFCWQYIYSDKIRLQKIMINLIDNAVKYTVAGSVTISVNPVGYYADPTAKPAELHPISCVHKSPTELIQSLVPIRMTDYSTKEPKGTPYAVKLRFQVVDTGVGIPAQTLPSIFEPFSVSNPDKDGPGLGLCVSQRLVQGLGGNISVESTVNEGSRFWFDLDVPVTECKQPELGGTIPLAEGDSSVSGLIRTGTVPGRSKACLATLTDLKDRHLLGRFYFCKDSLTVGGEYVHRQLSLCGFPTSLQMQDDLITLAKERRRLNHPSDSPGRPTPCSRPNPFLDVIVLDEQLEVFADLVQHLQPRDTLGFPQGSFFPIVLFLCTLGAEEVLWQSLSAEQRDHVCIVAKPLGVVNLLQSVHRLLDMLTEDSLGSARIHSPIRSSSSSSSATPRTPAARTFSSSSSSSSNLVRGRRSSTLITEDSGLQRSLSSVGRRSSTAGSSLAGSRRPSRAVDPGTLPLAVEDVEEREASMTPQLLNQPQQNAPPAPRRPGPSPRANTASSTLFAKRRGHHRNSGPAATTLSEDSLDLAQISSQLQLNSSPKLTPPKPLPVLVVEDNSFNQMIIRHLLVNKMGLDCEIVDNGRKALEAWSEHEYAVIFMDIQMPVMDGLTAMREIRRLEQLEHRKHTWIVAMTGLAFMQDRDAAIQAGCDEFLSKPVDMEVLQSMVAMWIATPTSFNRRTTPPGAPLAHNSKCDRQCQSMMDLTASLKVQRCGSPANPVF